MNDKYLQFFVLFDAVSQRFLCEYNIYGSIPLPERIVMDRDISRAKVFSNKDQAEGYIHRWSALRDPYFQWEVWHMSTVVVQSYPLVYEA